MSKILCSKTRKTRKPHMCFGCAKTYPAGTVMDYTSYVDGGSVSSCYWCGICKEYVRRHFEQGDETACGQIYSNDPDGWEQIRAELESEG